IEQVLLNLLMNAATHGKTATGVTLYVESGRDRVTFRAEDDGAGIRPDLLPHLFDGTIGTREAGGEGAAFRTSRTGEGGPLDSGGASGSGTSAESGKPAEPSAVRSVGRRHMGIGLSVCEAIVRAHGGTMEAGNRPQGGAQVSFWLPWHDKE
ncbi:MAG: hypothetical protein IJT94_12120, partial [Oscillibacter sp.]|nr:hypothetical protein [Oscillibacter sp.]